MSFVRGVGMSLDGILLLGTTAWQLYQSCKNVLVKKYDMFLKFKGKDAPEAFEEASHEVSALHTALNAAADEVQDLDSILYRSTRDEQQNLGSILQNCKSVLQDLERILTKYRSLGTDKKRLRDRIRFANKNLKVVREKLTIYTGAIGLFFTTLNSSTLGRIEKKLEDLLKDHEAGRRAPNFSMNAAGKNDGALTRWDSLKQQLLKKGLSSGDLEDYKDYICVRFRKLVINGELFGRQSFSTDNGPFIPVGGDDNENGQLDDLEYESSFKRNCPSHAQIRVNQVIALQAFVNTAQLWQDSDLRSQNLPWQYSDIAPDVSQSDSTRSPTLRRRRSDALTEFCETTEKFDECGRLRQRKVFRSASVSPATSTGSQSPGNSPYRQDSPHVFPTTFSAPKDVSGTAEQSIASAASKLCARCKEPSILQSSIDSVPLAEAHGKIQALEGHISRREQVLSAFKGEPKESERLALTLLARFRSMESWAVHLVTSRDFYKRERDYYLKSAGWRIPSIVRDRPKSPGYFCCTFSTCLAYCSTKAAWWQHCSSSHPSFDLDDQNKLGPFDCEHIDKSSGSLCSARFKEPFQLLRHETVSHGSKWRTLRCQMGCHNNGPTREDPMCTHLAQVLFPRPPSASEAVKAPA